MRQSTFQPTSFETIERPPCPGVVTPWRSCGSPQIPPATTNVPSGATAAAGKWPGWLSFATIFWSRILLLSRNIPRGLAIPSPGATCCVGWAQVGEQWEGRGFHARTRSGMVMETGTIVCLASGPRNSQPHLAVASNTK